VLTVKLISMLFGGGASTLAVTEAQDQHKRLLPYNAPNGSGRRNLLVGIQWAYFQVSTTTTAVDY